MNFGLRGGWKGEVGEGLGRAGEGVGEGFGKGWEEFGFLYFQNPV